MRDSNIDNSIFGRLSILGLRPRERGKVDMEGLGQIKILAEREVKMIELDVDVDQKTREIICHAALREITSDGDALFNYGFNQALKRFIQNKGKKCTQKKKNKKSSRR